MSGAAPGGAAPGGSASGGAASGDEGIARGASAGALSASSPSATLVGAGGDTAVRVAIQKIVRQPLPLLLVDRIVGRGPSWLETEFSVPWSGPLLRGEGEGLVLPGTLTCEQAVQAGELFIHGLRGATAASDGVPVLTRMRNVRFRGMVRPGDVVRTRVELIDQVGPAYVLAAVAHVERRLVLEARLTFGATKAVARAANDTGG